MLLLGWNTHYFAIFLNVELSPFSTVIKYMNVIYDPIESTKTSVRYMMTKLATKPSSVSSRTGDNRTMKLFGGLSSVASTSSSFRFLIDAMIANCTEVSGSDTNL